MFEIRAEDDDRVLLIGRFDAAQTQKAQDVLYKLKASTVVDCQDLRYCASAAFGILFEAQRRLLDVGHSLTLVNLSPHLRELFDIGGFDRILRIE